MTRGACGKREIPGIAVRSYVFLCLLMSQDQGMSGVATSTNQGISKLESCGGARKQWQCAKVSEEAVLRHSARVTRAEGRVSSLCLRLCLVPVPRRKHGFTNMLARMSRKRRSLTSGLKKENSLVDQGKDATARGIDRHDIVADVSVNLESWPA